MELFTVIPLAVITLFFGVYPRPFLDLISSTMNVIIDTVANMGGIAGLY
jgi:NADH:ubiquinone oxidoreductase subunit 4 (subunit M)